MCAQVLHLSVFFFHDWKCRSQRIQQEPRDAAAHVYALTEVGSAEEMLRVQTK